MPTSECDPSPASTCDAVVDRRQAEVTGIHKHVCRGVQCVPLQEDNLSVHVGLLQPTVVNCESFVSLLLV